MTANSMLSPNEQKFASIFSAVTKLDPTVVAAWIRNEQPNIDKVPGNGDYNYLGIGIQSSSTKYGVNAPDWKDPLSAGVLSAEWMLGAKSVPDSRLPNGYSSAGSIRAIASTAGQSPDTQMAAIQASHWAAGGETSIQDIYKSMKAVGGFQPQSVAQLAGLGGHSLLNSGLFIDGNGIHFRSGPSGGNPLTVGATTSSTPSKDTTSGGFGLGDLSNFLGDLVNKNLWIRVVEIIGGVIMALAGAILLGKEMT